MDYRYIPFYVQGNAITGLCYGQWQMAEDRDIDYVKEMYPMTFSRIQELIEKECTFPHLHTYTLASILTCMDSANILTYLPSPAQIPPGSSEDLRNPFSFLHKEKAKTVWR